MPLGKAIPFERRHQREVF